MKRVTVEAPASSANLGPGFDVFGLALAKPLDRLRLTVEKSAKLEVKIDQRSGVALPLNAEENGAGIVALGMAKDFGIKARMAIELWKKVPIGVGIGSSASSAAAAAVAVNEAFGLSLGDDELTYYAGKGEEGTSGTAHYDNVAPSILGGFVVVRGGRRPSPVRFAAPKGMALCIATPKLDLPKKKTEYARSLLPGSISLGQMVENVAYASTVVSGFARGDIAMIGEGMRDAVVEPARKRMIPGYDDVRKGALGAGAFGICISGAGPSMLAVAEGRAAAERVLKAMAAGFRRAGVVADGFTTTVGEGARVIESK